MNTNNVLKCKVVPVYAIKAWGLRCIAPLIPNSTSIKHEPKIRNITYYYH